jgi:hypothetical protein
MKDPKDILLMSLDEQDKGLWKVMPKEQVEKLEKELKRLERQQKRVLWLSSWGFTSFCQC